MELNLQRFAGEKTERATPQRRREARKEGKVARSAELTSAIGLLAVLVGLKIFGTRIWSTWMSTMTADFGNAQRPDFTQTQLVSLLDTQMLALVKLLLPLMLIGFFAVGITAFTQVGALFLPSQITPDFKRIDPFAGFKRLFSARSMVEAAKSLLKLLLVGAVAYSVVQGSITTVANLDDVDLVAYPGVVGKLVFKMAVEIAALMLVLGGLDYAYQRYDFEKSIRMSREDIKEENKRQEGDPIVKGQIRQRGRALATRRMMQEVEKADVVITNPTHFAVAIVYDSHRASAPIVVAKGQDEVARRIRELAQDRAVPLVENRPLAQALYRQVDIGSVIPEELYQAVAEVLAYVYNLKNRIRG